MGKPELDHLRFCLALHRAVAGEGDSCFSPYSVASALGLTSQASRGAASDELVRLLAAEDADVAKQAELLRAAAALSESGRHEAPVLAVANTLWTAEELPLNQDFLGELAAWPNGAVKPAPFAADPEAARRAINADVARTTRDLIPELLSPGAVKQDTVASLVNALYLKVAWVHRFRDERTEDGDFHSPSGIRRVPMMHQAESLGHAARDGWQLVELPAAGGVQATILLPDGDLSAHEPGLDEHLLAKLLSAKKNRQVRLAMPKVSLDMRAELKPALGGLGVRTMFSPRADFSPLTPDERVFVDDVLHQSVLRLDEQGLEGAAATAVMFRTLSMVTPADPLDVVVDRPFLLLVRHAGTGVVYFFARVVEP
ncbi:serpin family protein [Amycolatopsis acidiphila]|uniref:Serpin family protein n=1 Tax=Amycolatopsis acidiphila TaxID=715473 RepID=A0A558A694_9PSEU|nr:serpin family protein [Amycolatopsis acidiphila]TVT19780.1 serpin family protein [Amycolatopsis acidiphila]UIJ61853.1 serpin family protein [Amycolatopsis acidiphila]GHG57553.1 serine protease [Amycolatopsis acidiphila]